MLQYFLNYDIDIWRIIFLFNPKMQHKRCERFLTEQSVSGRLPDTIWKFSVLLISIAPRLRTKKKRGYRNVNKVDGIQSETRGGGGDTEVRDTAHV